MSMTESQKKADKKYREKHQVTTFAIAYKNSDMQEGQRLKSYLELTKQSANSYIKKLIKADLDSKGFVVDESGIVDND